MPDARVAVAMITHNCRTEVLRIIVPTLRKQGYRFVRPTPFRKSAAGAARLPA